MSTSARILAVAGTLVVLVIAFVVLSPGDEKQPSRTAGAPPARTVTGAPAPRRASRFTTIVVRDGKPVGGVKRIRLVKGDRARIEIASPDTSDEIHVHGYDLMRELEAGGEVRFSFPADADGIYEIELERAGVQIASLVVEPR